MSVARTYAKALFDVAQESKNGSRELTQERKGIQELIALLESSKELRVALLGPATSSKEKAAILDSISEQAGHSDLLTRFLSLLAKKGRLVILSDIFKAIEEVRLESEGGVLGEVYSPEELSAAEMKELSKSFEKKLGKKVDFRMTEDPSLLAGLKVTVNGVTYDGTLKAQLHRLKEEFSQGQGIVH